MADPIPPHMNPMTDAEVARLLGMTRHGPMPEPTVQRLLATLASWHNDRHAAPKPADVPAPTAQATHWLITYGQRSPGNTWSYTECVAGRPPGAWLLWHRSVWPELQVYLVCALPLTAQQAAELEGQVG